MSLKVLLPWQHTEFQTSPILKAFLATFSILFLYFLSIGNSFQIWAPLNLSEKYSIVVVLESIYKFDADFVQYKIISEIA